MKIAFALDGVLCKHPWIFQGFIRLLRRPYKVIILTSHVGIDSLKKDREYLKRSGIHFCKIIEKPVAGISSARFKAQICQEEKIDVLFESDPEIVKIVNKTTDTLVLYVVQKVAQKEK